MYLTIVSQTERNAMPYLKGAGDWRLFRGLRERGLSWGKGGGFLTGGFRKGGLRFCPWLFDNTVWRIGRGGVFDDELCGGGGCLVVYLAGKRQFWEKSVSTDFLWGGVV